MPTKKPVIQIVLDEETYQKLKDLSENEDRSMSKQGARIIREHFKKNEEEFAEEWGDITEPK